MVKQSVSSMGRFFNRERFGPPQIAAGLLILIFVAQCIWLLAHEVPNYLSEDIPRVNAGVAQWHGRSIAGAVLSPAMRRPDTSAYDPDHSPLWYLIDSAPVALVRVSPDSVAWLCLTRLPFIVIAALLGASLWYVSHRLYGNVGGYTALGLYCFSPTVIRSATLWFSPPNIAGAWGTFGAVFTAIAVCHTLYAPREVVLWNWRRILLLGVSIALAVGSEFGLVVILPVLLLFMFYLAPNRRAAALAIFVAASVIATFLLWAAYFFHPGAFLRGLALARWFNTSATAFTMPAAYLQVARELAASGPVLVILVPLALFFYVAWPRCRYFGNTGPLLVAILFLVLRVASPHGADSPFLLIAVTFVFLFVAGIAADLLETKAKDFTAAILAGLVSANALWSLIGLARIPR